MFEFHHTRFESASGEAYNARQSGWALFTTANVLLRGNTHAVVEIPLVQARYAYDFQSGQQSGDFQNSDSEVGSPYIGFNWSRPGNSWIAEFGFMLPVIGGINSATDVVSSAMFSDKREAYDPKTLALAFSLGHREVDWQGFAMRQTVKAVLHEYFYFDLQFDVVREYRRAFFQIGYVGRIRVGQGWGTELTLVDVDKSSGAAGGKRYSSELLVAIGPRSDQLEAGFNIVLPLDEFYPYSPDFVWGFNLRYFFELRASREFE